MGEVDMDNPIDIANKMFRTSLTDAVGTIAFLAEHSQNEKIRLEAAKYVVERNLGAIKREGTSSGDRWDDLIKDITVRDGDREYRRVQKNWKDKN